MNPLIEKNKGLVVIAVIVFISLFLAKKANDMNVTKCDQLKTEIKNEEEKTETLDRIVGLNEQLKKLREKGWDTTNFEAVVKRISDLCVESNIKIVSIMPIDRKDLGDYVEIPFSASGELTYRNLVKLLKKLDKEKKLFRLKEISLMPLSGDIPKGGQADIALSLTLSGAAIYFK